MGHILLIQSFSQTIWFKINVILVYLSKDINVRTAESYIKIGEINITDLLELETSSTSQRSIRVPSRKQQTDFSIHKL